MKLTQADLLIGLAQDAKLFYAPSEDAGYATIKANDHEETWPLRSKALKRWLVSRFMAVESKPPGAQAVADAIGALEADSQFRGYPRHETHVRLAGDTECIYLDLANEMWEAVKITASGWEIIAAPPVKFRRPRGMKALPTPARGGSLLALRPFLNAADDESWTLMVSWLLAATRPTGPYPVLSLLGEQGTAKTTNAEVFKRLVDPSKAPVRSEPRDVRDLMIAATNGRIIAYDNLSHIEDWLSDALCRMATGGGFSTRELYSDGDEIIFDAERPVILTGIEECVVRADLLDRALLVTLPVIPDSRRRSEGEFWAEFDGAAPALLGGLLDVVATALRRAPDVQLAKLPRMADFALWTTAAAPALGWTEDIFLNLYAHNRQAAHEVALEASLVAPLVRELAESGTWEGTAGALLEKLTTMASDLTRKAKAWPKNGRALAGILRRLAPSLRKVDVEVVFSQDHGQGPPPDRHHQQESEDPDRPDRPASSERPSGAEPERTQPDDGAAERTMTAPDEAGHRPAETTRQTTLSDIADGADDELPPRSISLCVLCGGDADAPGHEETERHQVGAARYVIMGVDHLRACPYCESDRKGRPGPGRARTPATSRPSRNVADSWTGRWFPARRRGSYDVRRGPC